MGERLGKSEALGDGLRRIASEQCARAAVGLERPTDEQVHAARVRIKRVRAILALLDGSMGGVERSEGQALREVARGLAGARDPASLREALAGLRERFGTLDPGAFETVDRELGRRAESGRRAGVGAASIAVARQALIQAGERAARWPLESDGFGLVSGGLRRTYARVRRDRRAALASDDPAQRHAWRTRVKRLAEQMRVLECLWPSMLRAHAKALRRIGDRLGQDHDLALLAAALRGDAERFGGAPALSIARLAERTGKGLVRSCRRDARRALAETPGAFMARMEALFRARR